MTTKQNRENTKCKTEPNDNLLLYVSLHYQSALRALDNNTQNKNKTNKRADIKKEKWKTLHHLRLPASKPLQLLPHSLLAHSLVNMQTQQPQPSSYHGAAWHFTSSSLASTVQLLITWSSVTSLYCSNIRGSVGERKLKLPFAIDSSGIRSSKAV